MFKVAPGNRCADNRWRCGVSHLDITAGESQATPNPELQMTQPLLNDCAISCHPIWHKSDPVTLKLTTEPNFR